MSRVFSAPPKGGEPARIQADAPYEVPTSPRLEQHRWVALFLQLSPFRLRPEQMAYLPSSGNVGPAPRCEEGDNNGGSS